MRNKPRILLSDLIRLVVADAKELLASGTTIYLPAWLIANSASGVCSVCLGGVRLLKEMPDVLEKCEVNLPAKPVGRGSLRAEFLHTELPNLYRSLWKEMVALDEVRRGLLAQAFSDYYVREESYDTLLHDIGDKFTGRYSSPVEFERMAQALLAAADLIAQEESHLGITITP